MESDSLASLDFSNLLLILASTLNYVHSTSFFFFLRFKYIFFICCELMSGADTDSLRHPYTTRYCTRPWRRCSTHSLKKIWDRRRWPDQVACSGTPQVQPTGQDRRLRGWEIERTVRRVCRRFSCLWRSAEIFSGGEAHSSRRPGLQPLCWFNWLFKFSGEESDTVDFSSAPVEGLTFYAWKLRLDSTAALTSF